MNILFVDDMEERHKAFLKRKPLGSKVYCAHTYDQAIWHLGTIQFDILFLDHDLSETAIMCDPDNIDERTGTDLAKEIVSLDLDPKPGIVIHSLNPVGAERMHLILKDAGYDAVRIPFYMLSSHLRIGP